LVKEKKKTTTVSLPEGLFNKLEDMKVYGGFTKGRIIEDALILWFEKNKKVFDMAVRRKRVL